MTKKESPDAGAELILEITKDLEDAIKREAAQLVCAEIAKVQAVLYEASNKLAIIVAGYRAGSLPKTKP